MAELLKKILGCPFWLLGAGLYGILEGWNAAFRWALSSMDAGFLWAAGQTNTRLPVNRAWSRYAPNRRWGRGTHSVVLRVRPRNQSGPQKTAGRRGRP